MKYIKTANINNSIYVKKGGFLNVLMGGGFDQKVGAKEVVFYSVCNMHIGWKKLKLVSNSM